MWDHVGMARTAKGLQTAIQQIRSLRDEFWHDVKVMGTGEQLNQNLEHAGRVADFMEFAELLTLDALVRDESCGGHFREEHQTPEGECQRNDDQFCHVSAWEFRGVGSDPVLHKEPLNFEEVPAGNAQLQVMRKRREWLSLGLFEPSMRPRERIPWDSEDIHLYEPDTENLAATGASGARPVRHV